MYQFRREELKALTHRFCETSVDLTLGLRDLEVVLQGLEERVPVLKSTDALPLGLTEEAADSPLCAPFRASPGDNLTVAVVGNGPLNEAQRREIDAYDIVVR